MLGENLRGFQSSHLHKWKPFIKSPLNNTHILRLCTTIGLSITSESLPSPRFFRLHGSLTLLVSHGECFGHYRVNAATSIYFSCHFVQRKLACFSHFQSFVPFISTIPNSIMLYFIHHLHLSVSFRLMGDTSRPSFDTFHPVDNKSLSKNKI